MSHLTTELCPKYPGEQIQQWEYNLEASEWATIGFTPTALAEGIRHRLPQSCFFSQAATKDQVLQTWTRIRSRLSRKVRLECTIGESFGKDLQPIRTPSGNTPASFTEDEPAVPSLTARPQPPLLVPPEDALSSAFNKLFGPPHL